MIEKKGRGAPRKAQAPPSCVTAQIGVEERSLLERAAAKDGRTLSNFLKIALVERATRILGE